MILRNDHLDLMPYPVARSTHDYKSQEPQKKWLRLYLTSLLMKEVKHFLKRFLLNGIIDGWSNYSPQVTDSWGQIFKVIPLIDLWRHFPDLEAEDLVI